MQAREFYSRPNRLQKPIWPPHDFSSDAKHVIVHHSPATPLSTSQELPAYSSRLSNQLALREQFFNSSPSSLQMAKSASPTPYSSMPTSPHFVDQNISNSTGNIMDTAEDSSRRMASSPIPQPPTLRMVSEYKKQFESGRPLSPDGIDRQAMYKSELSR